MAITKLSSREFNQDTSRAKRAAKRGPVFITNRGRPSHVLLTVEEYQRRIGASASRTDSPSGSGREGLPQGPQIHDGGQRPGTRAGSVRGEDRKQESLDGFWGTLTDAQREAIQAVAMDMWDPYVESVREHVADAGNKIVFDKFHVAQHLSQAVDEVRRKENKALRAAGDDRLKGTRYDWLRNPASMDPMTGGPSTPYATAN